MLKRKNKILRINETGVPYSLLIFRHSVGVNRAVKSESEGILGGVGVGKTVPTPTPT
jgi:hypothetical protein